jgi:hypothetical protein
MQALNTRESDRLHHESPVTCVIAQQHSSATFVSFRFHFRKENFGAFQKCHYFNYFNVL